MDSESKTDEKKTAEPKERIELLLSSPSGRDRRIYDRTAVEPGATVYFPMVYKGEVMDVSDEGLSIRMQPLDSPSLAENAQLRVSLPMESGTFSIPGTVRRVESKFGVIVLGLQCELDEIEHEKKQEE